MIDISALDKNKAYIGLSFDNGFISNLIEATEQGGKDLKVKASHVLGLAYDVDDFYIWEAHLIYKGVRRIKFTDYIKEKELDKSNKIIFKEFDMDIVTLNFYYYFKRFYPYDVTNILFRLLDKVPFFKGQDTKNLICSKFISMAQTGYKLCYKYNIPYDMVTPAHCQEYVEDLPAIFIVN